MQKCVSLELKVVPVREAKEIAGWLVPWEVNGYFEDYEKARRMGGVFDLSHWGVVELEGPDAKDYLHRMSTWNAKAAEAGRIDHIAFLTGKAHPIAMGFIETLGPDKFHLIFPPGQAAVAAGHIEKFHFAERLTVTDKSAEYALFGLWNLEDNVCAELGFSRQAEALRIHNGVFRDDSRPDLFWVKIAREAFLEYFDLVRTQYADLLGYRVFEMYRIAAGVPQVGIELGSSDIILEGNLDRAVARNKGCYPGQEVVERIFTYGQVNKKLLPVALEGEGNFPAPPFVFSDDGKPVGTVVSYAGAPESNLDAVGLAFVNKHYWESDKRFTSDADAAVGVRLR